MSVRVDSVLADGCGPVYRPKLTAPQVGKTRNTRNPSVLTHLQYLNKYDALKTLHYFISKYPEHENIFGQRARKPIYTI